MRPASDQILALYTSIQITYLLILNVLILNVEMKTRSDLKYTNLIYNHFIKRSSLIVNCESDTL